MSLSKTYSHNKPLCNALLGGFLYFLFCWSIAFSQAGSVLFSFLMLFLPGITFPLTTCYFKTEATVQAETREFFHLLLSVGIYHGAVWLFSGEGHFKYLSLVAGFTGSLFFLIATKYLLKKEITWPQMLLTAIVSGLAFLPYALIHRSEFYLGLAVFMWTVANGFLLNLEWTSPKSGKYHL